MTACQWDQWRATFTAPLWRSNLYISLGVWGHAKGKVMGERPGQDSLTCLLAQVTTRRQPGGPCRAALRGMVIACGWQMLCRLSCHAEDHWGFEITVPCNKDPSSSQQLVSAHCHCGVKLHRETRQLLSKPDRLTSNMSHVCKPSDGASHSVWYLY